MKYIFANASKILSELEFLFAYLNSRMFLESIPAGLGILPILQIPVLIGNGRFIGSFYLEPFLILQPFNIYSC